MALRAVLFDIDDTLYSTTDFAAHARRAAVRAMIRLGLHGDEDEIYRELLETIAEFGSNYEHHYSKLLDRLPQVSLRGVNRAVLVAAGVAAYHDSKFRRLRPFPDVLPALRGLSRLPLVLGVVTDGLAVKQAEKLLRLGVYPFMTPRAIFISDQIGIAKPNPKIYLRACHDLGMRPEEVVVVGDHPVKDIDAAKRAGALACLVRRGGRHAGEPGRTRPDFSVSSLKELLTLLSRRLKVRTSS